MCFFFVSIFVSLLTSLCRNDDDDNDDAVLMSKEEGGFLVIKVRISPPVACASLIKAAKNSLRGSYLIGMIRAFYCPH